MDTDFLLFLKDLKHPSTNSSWTPRYLRKVSQIFLCCKQILILPHLFLQTPCSAFPVAHGPCAPSRFRPGQHLQRRSGIRSSVHPTQLGGGAESLRLTLQCPARTWSRSQALRQRWCGTGPGGRFPIRSVSWEKNLGFLIKFLNKHCPSSLLVCFHVMTVDI